VCCVAMLSAIRNLPLGDGGHVVRRELDAGGASRGARRRDRVSHCEMPCDSSFASLHRRPASQPPPPPPPPPLEADPKANTPRKDCEWLPALVPPVCSELRKRFYNMALIQAPWHSRQGGLYLPHCRILLVILFAPP
jgi:hypothetical protein